VANYVETPGPALLSAILILAAAFFVARWVSGKLAKRGSARKELATGATPCRCFRAPLAAAGTCFALVTAAGTAGMNVTALVPVWVWRAWVWAWRPRRASNIVAGLTIAAFTYMITFFVFASLEMKPWRSRSEALTRKVYDSRV